jgi:ammonium transporter, Amt family
LPPFDFSTVDSGSTAWVLASAALVLLMTPGLAFFYGGMVRAKNVLAMLMQNFFCMGIVAVLWVVVGYSLAFGGSNGFIGGFHFVGLANMTDQVPGYTDTLAQVIPPLAFVAFQLTFAIITPALFTGSTADRWKFGAFVTFVTLWAVLVYAPVAHWVFSPEGWLFKRGAQDFAGGTVVHANAGVAGLALALVLGKRRGWPGTRFRPHNLPFVMLGAGLLWFGWFGFNAGSWLGTGNSAAGVPVVAYAWVNTCVAAGAAMLAWLGTEKLRDGFATTLGAASGVVAGLVAITPAAGYVQPMGAIAIGLIAGGCCALVVPLKEKLGYDDSLDVVGVHLVGGVLGALLVGWFGTSKINGADGVFYGGGFSLLGKQAEAVGAVLVYSFVATLIIAKVVDLVMGMRVSDEDEQTGLDTTMHSESGYEFGAGLGTGTPPRPPLTTPTGSRHEVNA